MLASISYLLSVITSSANLKATEVKTVLSSHTMSLETRYKNAFVNEVFKDNILLTLNYLDGRVGSAKEISWDEVRKDFTYELSLKPGEGFAFHDAILPEYKEVVTKTTNAHFNYKDGFKSDGYLMGDGVCHLASLIYWSAKDAGLTAVAPRNHDFAIIPEVPKEYGVAIYATPTNPYASSLENLYIVNNKDKGVNIVFEYKNNELSVSVTENA